MSAYENQLSVSAAGFWVSRSSYGVSAIICMSDLMDGETEGRTKRIRIIGITYWVRDILTRSCLLRDYEYSIAL
jgi:hypothetical protein